MTEGRRGREEFRFDARFGSLQRKTGIAAIPFALLFYQAELEIAPPELWLIVFVLAHRWTSDLPYPAVREIERRSGVSKKTLLKYKAALETKGYLETVHRTRPDGGNTSIGWDFSPLFERIDELIVRDLEWWKTRNPHFIDEEPWAGGAGRAAGSPANPPPGVPAYTRAGIDASTGAGVCPSPRASHQGSPRADKGATPHVKEDPTEDPDEAITALDHLWAEVLSDLREQVVPANYSRWLSRTSLLSCEDGQATVVAPDRICADQLTRRLDPLIRRSLAGAFGQPVTVHYTARN